MYFIAPDQFTTIIHAISKFGFPNKNTHTLRQTLQNYKNPSSLSDTKKNQFVQAELLHKNKQHSLGIFHQ